MFAIAMLLSQTAWAACERELKALEGAEGEGVAAAYGKLAACDAAKAKEAFPAAVKRSGDVVSLAAVALVAIDAGVAEPVHGLLELIPDYAAREETARAIGGRCGDDPKVEAFVLGLHDALKDRAFVGWAGALRACGTEGLTARLEELAGSPPNRTFDDKYATVVELYARKRGAKALPVLQKAAAAAASGGPFAVVVDAMIKAVTPEGIGGKPSAADRDALVAALSALAGSVSDGDGLRRLASAMVTVEAPDAAGALLPKLYPDRVQDDGAFLYGVAATESCDDAAVVHWAVVEDLGQRWSITEDVDARARGFKAKLKCDAEWAIQITPEPVAEEDEIEVWAEGLVEAAGDGAKLKGEKPITLE
jgi:hypothetical protein